MGLFQSKESDDEFSLDFPKKFLSKIVIFSESNEDCKKVKHVKSSISYITLKTYHQQKQRNVEEFAAHVKFYVLFNDRKPEKMQQTIYSKKVHMFKTSSQSDVGVNEKTVNNHWINVSRSYDSKTEEETEISEDESNYNSRTYRVYRKQYQKPVLERKPNELNYPLIIYKKSASRMCESREDSPASKRKTPKKQITAFSSFESVAYDNGKFHNIGSEGRTLCDSGTEVTESAVESDRPIWFEGTFKNISQKKNNNNKKA
ncbi:uncharacterized protein LOC111631175 [Centruroides sculpturatus]|uniref:uncharacterized protein LOC111631175 n=1 Tax=Centruroides sculpturatus TaxID=218467 RepID=UPI000C6E68BB|nr:uncharacterized protein LOC111631175 [Centruroides sculpturatus]